MPDHLGLEVDGNLEAQPERRGYRPISTGCIATLPEATLAQELNQSVQNLKSSWKQSNKASFRWKVISLHLKLSLRVASLGWGAKSHAKDCAMAP